MTALFDFLSTPKTLVSGLLLPEKKAEIEIERKARRTKKSYLPNFESVPSGSIG